MKTDVSEQQHCLQHQVGTETRDGFAKQGALCKGGSARSCWDDLSLSMGSSSPGDDTPGVLTWLETLSRMTYGNNPWIAIKLCLASSSWITNPEGLL